MNYETAVHEAGHIVGYASYGFTDFQVTTGEPGRLAAVTPIIWTERNYVRNDSDMVSLMGPEAELTYNDDYEEYERGAHQDWVSVFGNYSETRLGVIEVALDWRTKAARFLVEQYWSQITQVADRLANGERRIKIADGWV